MTRDNVEVPPIMQKCCEAIEKYGIKSQGIYRLSGTTSKVANLKLKLDRGQPFFLVLFLFFAACRKLISLYNHRSGSC